MKSTTLITFIGGGNMATSLLEGLLSASSFESKINVSEPVAEKRNEIEKRFLVTAFSDNHCAALDADVIILCVKPQKMHEAILSLEEVLKNNNPLLISIAAGITTSCIEKWCGTSPALIRVMPNTPSIIRAGISVLFSNTYATEAQCATATKIMKAVGATLWINSESLMDAVTAVSGSGPAYFFYVMQAMQEAAVEEGLSGEIAKTLTLQTALGAIQLALQSEKELMSLKNQVTSPGGTTEAALAVLDVNKVSETIKHAISAARKRAKTLSEDLDKN